MNHIELNDGLFQITKKAFSTFEKNADAYNIYFDLN